MIFKTKHANLEYAVQNNTFSDKKLLLSSRSGFQAFKSLHASLVPNTLET